MRNLNLFLLLCAVIANAPISIAKSNDALPFIGRRAFNFYGGTGTGYEISIKQNGDTTIVVIGVCENGLVYSGKFSDKMRVDDNEFVIIGQQKAKLMRGARPAFCDSSPCESSLESVHYPPLKIGKNRC